MPKQLRWGHENSGFILVLWTLFYYLEEEIELLLVETKRIPRIQASSSFFYVFEKFLVLKTQKTVHCGMLMTHFWCGNILMLYFSHTVIDAVVIDRTTNIFPLKNSVFFSRVLHKVEKE
jgi:uncharacterized membrane protein